MIRRIVLGLLAALVMIQFFRPERNLSNDNTFAIPTKYHVPPEVDAILRKACNDCHSNATRYPWYANIQPVGWWLAGHIKNGRSHLNFSDFTNMPLARQYHKFEETVDAAGEGWMPLKSYTALGFHPEARLTNAEREILVNWANAQMDTLRSQYPADSLIRKRQ